MDEIELRLYKLEEKAKLLTPNGFTAKSFWTRVGTVLLYNLVVGGLYGIFWFLIIAVITLLST